jgi:excisionase family DNA binding protein
MNMKMTAFTAPGLLGEREAAEYLGGISQKHLYNLRRAGVIPFLRVGDRVMYRVATLEKWAAEQERLATQVD